MAFSKSNTEIFGVLLQSPIWILFIIGIFQSVIRGSYIPASVYVILAVMFLFHILGTALLFLRYIHDSK